MVACCNAYVSMKLPPAATKASRSSKAPFLSMEPSMPSQALPKLMAPSCNGETRMPAVLDRTLYLPNEVGGSGAGWNIDMLWLEWRGWWNGIEVVVWKFDQYTQERDLVNEFVSCEKTNRSERAGGLCLSRCSTRQTPRQSLQRRTEPSWNLDVNSGNTTLLRDSVLRSHISL